jgi:hypothetical protein
VRFTAALIFVAFLGLAAGDTFICCDGCRGAHSTQSADDCDATAACPLCAGAVAQAYASMELIHVGRVEFVTIPAVLPPLIPVAPSIDHPPRQS